jgi:type IV pilus assembly protein PilZ
MPEAARKMDKTLCKATQAPGTGTFTVVTGETAMVKIENDWAVCKDDPYACTGANKPGLLTLTIKDKSALYLAYMPFVKNGGLFIPTNSNYRLGDEVFMLLNLMGEDEKLPVAGRVIWLTPKGAQGKRTAGIGVQFSDQDRGQTQKKIETYLAGALAGDKATHTM